MRVPQKRVKTFDIPDEIVLDDFADELKGVLTSLQHPFSIEYPLLLVNDANDQIAWDTWE